MLAASGWLCPALFRYCVETLKAIYVQVKLKISFRLSRRERFRLRAAFHLFSPAPQRRDGSTPAGLAVDFLKLSAA